MQGSAASGALGGWRFTTKKTCSAREGEGKGYHRDRVSRERGMREGKGKERWEEGRRGGTYID